MNRKRKKPRKAKKLHKASAPAGTREKPNLAPPPPVPTTGPPQAPNLEPIPPAPTDETRDGLIADLETIAELLSGPRRR